LGNGSSKGIEFIYEPNCQGLKIEVWYQRVTSRNSGLHLVVWGIGIDDNDDDCVPLHHDKFFMQENSKCQIDQVHLQTRLVTVSNDEILTMEELALCLEAFTNYELIKF